MELRLYKNCKLTQEYDNVFNSKIVFERYLETLDATAYDINLETSYYSVQSDGTGSIPIDFNYVSDDQILGQINEYNYIRFTDSNYNIVRYCFVTSIAVQNGIAIINYLEDIWHNYVYGTKITNTYLAQARGVGSNPAKQIIDHASGKAPLVKEIKESEGKYCVIVKYQAYTTDTAGKITGRAPIASILGYRDPSTDEMIYEFSVDYSIEILIASLYTETQKQDALVVTSSFTKFMLNKVVDEDYNTNFEITDIYVVPAKYIYNVGWSDADHTANTLNFGVLPATGYFGYATSRISNTASYNITIEEINISDENYKIVSVGNYTMCIPVQYEGLGLTLQVKIFWSYSDFKIYYLFNKQIADVTECYNYNYPVSIESAENTQLKKLNVKLENDNYERSKISLVTDTFGAVGQFASGLLTGNPSAITGAASNLTDSFISKKNAQQRLQLITNAGLYTSNSAVNANSNALMNAMVDLVIFYVDSENEDVVSAINEKFGRVCYFYKGDLIINNTVDVPSYLSYEYYIVSDCDIFGNCVNDILRQLKNILMRGVRVWRVNINL